MAATIVAAQLVRGEALNGRLGQCVRGLALGVLPGVGIAQQESELAVAIHGISCTDRRVIVGWHLPEQ